jgi:AraC-like DNA-binding protein
VRAARSLDAFLADPIGSYLEARSFTVWVQNPRRFGTTHVGASDPADQPILRALYALPTHAALEAPFDVLWDWSAATAIDAARYRTTLAYVQSDGSALWERRGRFVAVRPPGVAGMTLAGMFREWVHAERAALVETRDEALEWLAVSEPDRAELRALWTTLDGTPLLRRLREHLAGELAHASVGGVAAALGESSRSLQRHLAALGTSFRDELTRARIESAKARLVDSDDKLEVISRSVGFRSLPGFVTAFGDAVGESPTEFRKRRRG